jgi:hypothetical protein
MRLLPVLAAMCVLATPLPVVIAGPVLSFISSPAVANQTVVLAGAGLDDQCTVVLTSLSTNTSMKVNESLSYVCRVQKHRVRLGRGTHSLCPVFLMYMKVPVIPGQSSPSSVKFLLPANVELDVFDVAVVDSAGNTSSPKRLNAPEPWWCQVWYMGRVSLIQCP